MPTGEEGTVDTPSLGKAQAAFMRMLFSRAVLPQLGGFETRFETRPYPPNTICVCVTTATSRPPSVSMRVVQTWVWRPR